MGVACSQSIVEEAAIGSLSASPTLVNAKPPVVFTVVAPPELPSFAPVSPAELEATTSALSPTVTPSPSESPSPLLDHSATPSPTLEPSPTPSPTPLPTFTPPALPLTSADEHYWLRRPVADGGVVWTEKSYPYGHTKGGDLRPHHGVEFNVPRGTEIMAAASGTVLVAGDDGTEAYGPTTNFYGNLVVIELDSRLGGQPVYNLYGHLSEIFVSQGQHVGVQEIIALSGASGVADGPHLHFEVRLGVNSYAHTRNPLLWLYPFPDRGTVAGRVIWPDGQLAHEAPIRLRRIDAPSGYYATTTYAAEGVNQDANWRENFALDDVDAGFYEVVVATGEAEFTQTVWVFPYRTSFVEIALDASFRSEEQ